jgi:hypothetical protein
MTKEEQIRLKTLLKIKVKDITSKEWKECVELNQRWLNELITEQKKDNK